MSRFSSIKTSEVDMARYREVNQPHMNISINDALRLVLMFKIMKFGFEPILKVQGDLSLEDMYNIGADPSYPIDVRIKFSEFGEFFYAAEVARNVDKVSNWEAFKAACHYYYSKERLNESSDFVGIAFQHWPQLEKNFFSVFDKFEF